MRGNSTEKRLNDEGRTRAMGRKGKKLMTRKPEMKAEGKKSEKEGSRKIPKDKSEKDEKYERTK